MDENKPLFKDFSAGHYVVTEEFMRKYYELVLAVEVLQDVVAKLEMENLMRRTL